MKPLSKYSAAGFTIIEMIVVMVILGILAAIAAPSWLAFLNRQRLNAAQAEAISAIREAQANAKKQKRAWEVCFQDDGNDKKVRWFVRPVPATDGSTCATTPTGPWNDLIGSDANKVAIDTANSTLTSGFYKIQFEHNGWVQGQQANNSQAVGQITFITRDQNNGSKRCVYVATLLGAVRTASNNDCSSN